MFSSVSTPRRLIIRLATVALLFVLAMATPAQAQTAEQALKDAFLADLETMRGKFIGLAEAFPADTYTWRPMDGVRSVSEVLMLIAADNR